MTNVNILLKTSLEKTIKTHGAYKLVPASGMNTLRARSTLFDGLLENFIFDMSVSKEAHKKAYPIRIPLNKGLVSYRLFLIHKDNADQFKQISTIDRLKKLIPGQGLGWNDVDILKCN